MPNPYPFPRRKLIAVSIAAAFSGLSSSAFAAPVTYGSDPSITLDATYSLPGIDAGATKDGMTDSGTFINSYVNGSGAGADLYLNKDDGSGNSVFFHTYGSTSTPTYFGARASGEGTFDAYTKSTYHTTVTNGTGVAQVGLFSFNVDYGEIGVYGPGTGSADLLLELRVDSGVVAQDRTTILQTATGIACSDDDSGILSGYMTCADAMSSSATSAGGLYNYGFGLAPGQTLTLDYDIVAHVSGVFAGGAGTDCYGGGGYGAELTGAVDGGEAIFPSWACANFNAIARSGDPPSSQFVSFNPSIRTTSVPEPGSLGLAGLALGGLAAARRRKREKQG